MRLLVTTKEPVFFGGVVGSKGQQVTRSATLRSKTDPRERIPALWLLDPYGCTPLGVSGGSNVTVGTTSPVLVPGVIKLDSDGSACSSNQNTIVASGTGTLIQAIPTSGTPKGVISLYALPPGATTCAPPACDPADVAGGRLVPQPQGSTERATRGPVDWRYNCKSSYPAYHGLAISSCTDGNPKYIDNLRSEIGTSGAVAGFTRWSSSYSCNPATGKLVDRLQRRPQHRQRHDVDDHRQRGDGQELVDDRRRLQRKRRHRHHEPAELVPRAVVIRNLSRRQQHEGGDGSWDVTGGTIDLVHVAVIQQNGYIKISSATPNWTAPTEGPFSQLSLWSEKSSNKYQINGGAGVSLEGIFFTPEADPLSLSGGGDWGQLQAQFISYRVAVSGGGTLTMAPNESMISLPPTNNVLIR
jgi:hypothetical protein